MKLSRRALLKRGLAAGTVGTGAAVGGAGCLKPPRAQGDGLTDDYRSWVYDPSTLGERGHVAFYALDAATIESNEEWFADATYRKYANYTRFLDLDALGVNVDAVDSLLLMYPRATATERSAVLTGSFRRGALEGRLRERFAKHATNEEVSIYWSPDDAAAVGVGNGHLVIGHQTDELNARTVVERVIATGRGAATRRVEASQSFDALTDAVGSGDDVSGFTHPRVGETDAEAGSFAGAVAKGHRYAFGPKTSKSRYVFVFETESAVDLDAVEAWVDANDDARLFGGYERVTVRQRGRIALVDGVVPTAEI